MRNKESDPAYKGWPLMYHKTREDIATYRSKSVELKLQWLEEQMEFFHNAMPERAKRIRDILREKDV